MFLASITTTVNIYGQVFQYVQTWVSVSLLHHEENYFSSYSSRYLLFILTYKDSSK
jgi:hypothetical protein